MKLLRGPLLSLVAILLVANLVIDGWHRGFASGYKMAMAEVALGIKDPDKFILNMLRLRLSEEIENDQN